MYNCPEEELAVEQSADGPDLVLASSSRAQEQRVFGDSEEIGRSFRKFCSLLYLRPTMKIELLGTLVEDPEGSSDCHPYDLLEEEEQKYHPKHSEPIKYHIGFNRNACEFGVCLYSGECPCFHLDLSCIF